MKKYEQPSVTVDVLDVEDVIAASSMTLHFNETGEVTGQTTDWKQGWNID